MRSRRVFRGIFRRFARVAFLILADLTAVAAAAFVAVGVMGETNGRWLELLPGSSVMALLVLAALHTYGAGPTRRDNVRLVLAAFLAVGAQYGLGLFYPGLAPGRGEALTLVPVLAMLLVAGRWFVEQVVRVGYRSGLGRRNALVIGSREQAWDVLERFRASEGKHLRIVGHLAMTAASDPTALGGLERLSTLIEEHDIRKIIVSASLPPAQFRTLVTECFMHGAEVSLVPAMIHEVAARVTGRSLLGWPLIELQVPRLHLFQLAAKRTLDIMVSALGMLLLSPIYVLVALAVKIESPGPVLFKQGRLGVGGKAFTLYKFRSMRHDAEEMLKEDPALYERYVNNNYKLPPHEDPRISSFGRFLRHSSLDELPQLFNVLRGDMSLVGPRPIVPPEIEEYGDRAPVFLGVKPGLTGLWQVNGRSEIGYPERVELELEYIARWSMGLDLKILLLTIPHLLHRRGAH